MTKQERPHLASTALATAQQQLQRLRDLYRQQSPAMVLAVDRVSPTPTQSSTIITKVNKLPEHLGWESKRLTAVLRQAIRPKQTVVPTPKRTPCVQPINTSIQVEEPSSTLRFYADIGLGMLRQEMAASGRIWLLLRHLQTRGQGWLTITTVRTHLTDSKSPWRVCGKRQLRNLLRQGEDIYWQQRNGRLWLRSVAKVAAALGVERLNGRPVGLPLKVLLQPMGKVRAHLYAAFHSGRREAPISRETVARITAVAPRTQRHYERQVGVQRQKHIAIGAEATTSTLQEGGWQHGQAAFKFVDKKGRQGQPGKQYLAWQLPNSYSGPHQRQPRGQQKRINQTLAVLFKQGKTGNDQTMVEVKRQKRFYGNGRLAAQAQNRTNDVCYWPISIEKKGRSLIWFSRL